MNVVKSKFDSIGVVGLGYVGLPLLYSFHKSGLKVVGFDIDQSKIDNINSGRTYIKTLSEAEMFELSSSNFCNATTDFSRLSDVDAIIICVPTPLDSKNEPEMKYVIDTATTISKYLRKGQLISLESTTWPGTTTELLTPILESGSGLKAEKDFFVIFSPEREDPGNTEFNTRNIPKIIGADSEISKKLGVELYKSAIEVVVPVSSTKVAEAAKLLENIFRSINIALVNELKVIFDRMDIDVFEVIEAAATKPFGFMKFTPGPGLGGHCIPIDPFYLTWKAKEFGIHTKFIELAGEINKMMPDYVVSKTIEALNFRKKPVNGSRILIIGVTYKPNVDDMRESPCFPIMDQLKNMGAQVDYYDPWIPVIPDTREHSEWQGQKSIEWSKKNIELYDAIVIVSNHAKINYNALGEWADIIVDTRNAMANNDMPPKNLVIKS